MTSTPVDAFNNWFQRKYGRGAPAPDVGGETTLSVAASLVATGVTAGTQDPSDRAINLATAMTNFIRPGTVSSPTYFVLWHASLLAAAGIDADAELLARISDRVTARDWDGALAIVKSRRTGGVSLSAKDQILAALGPEAFAKLRLLLN